MKSSVFRNPEGVERGLNLPAVVPYSFIGDASPAYHARLENLIVEIVGESSIRRRTIRPSRKGKFVAYKYEIFHHRFEDVESLFARVSKLRGTRFVV